MEENESVFREKSLQRVNSPEELDHYLKVTNPSFWLFLCAIIALLVGVLVWSVTGKIEGYVSVGCQVTNGEYDCYLSQSDYDRIKEGQILRIDEEEDEIASTSFESVSTSSVDSYLLNISSIDSDYAFLIEGKTDLSNGYYSGKIITETISPISFILN